MAKIQRLTISIVLHSWMISVSSMETEPWLLMGLQRDVVWWNKLTISNMLIFYLSRQEGRVLLFHIITWNVERTRIMGDVISWHRLCNAMWRKRFPQAPHVHLVRADYCLFFKYMIRAMKDNILQKIWFNYTKMYPSFYEHCFLWALPFSTDPSLECSSFRTSLLISISMNLTSNAAITHCGIAWKIAYIT